MSKAEFIVIEGQGFTGKTIQAERFADRLRAIGLDAVVTFHPGGIPEAVELRNELLDQKSDGTLDLETEVSLMSKSLELLYKQLIKPSLQDGKWVVSSRWWPSVEVYQGFEQGADIGLIRHLEKDLCEGFKPARIILIDVTPEEIFRRISSNSTRIVHAYNEKDMTKIIGRQQAYRKLAEENITGNWRMINGQGAIYEVESRVFSQVSDLMS